jgi:hypothetical protein
MRHFLDGDVDPALITRRFGTVRVDLHALDFCDAAVRDQMNIDAAQLTGDDFSYPQQVVAYAQGIGFGAVIIPSAASHNCRTLVVLEAGRAGLSVGRTSVMTCHEANIANVLG